MIFDLKVGDCLVGMELLATGGIDVTVTSPPYNRGVAYRSYGDRLAREDYLAWSARWIAETYRVLSDNGSFFLNLGESSSDPLLPHEVLLGAVEAGFRLQNSIHWIKAISIDQADGSVLSRGQFRPIKSRCHLNACHEYVFHLTKSGKVPVDRDAVGVPYADKSNIKRWSHSAEKDRRCRGNTWFVPYPTIRSRERERPHPATFPVELAVKCLLLHGKSAPVVLDPFTGIGSTAIAAVRVGAAQFLGFEIDAEYVEIATNRVAREMAEVRPI